MRDPDQWPRWPHLHVKRTAEEVGHSDFVELGLLIEQMEVPLAAPPLVNPWVENPASSLPRIATYSTFEEMYDDGWRVADARSTD